MSTPSLPIRLLHLENSALDAEIVRHKLEAGGVACEVVLVESRDQFEAALQRERFDLILCDYNLPDYDGPSALKRARALRPDAPVIMISGSIGEEEAVRSLQGGATDYLLKDRLERLVPAVRRAIREAEEHRSRVRAEEELQERERRLSSIYDAVPEGLFYLEISADGLHRIVSINPAFRAISGLTDANLVGRPIHEVISGSVRDNCATAIREKRIVRWEQTTEFPNGTLTAELSLAPVCDRGQRCTHLVGMIHDLTERKHLETQLRQAQKMESVGQLAGGIAHDFNNLLTVINGTAELALEQLNAADTVQLEDDLQEIRRAGERAAGLTRQLLAFSRKQIVQPQVLDVNTVVTQLGAMLRRLLGEDVQLVIVPSSYPAVVKIDRGQLEQVVANLSVNARDAMPHGGTLTIETTLVAAQALLAGNGNNVKAESYVALTVRDTGTGMDDETRRRMFEPFFTTKGAGKGTGLGLSTVYGIVNQQDGFIEVDSVPGQGTCFTIYLPAVAGAVTTAAPDVRTKHVGGKETILIVEDVAALRRLMTRALQAKGYTVLVADSGDEALSMIEHHMQPIQLMITDVVMPGMSGPKLAERLVTIIPDMKVLYMSGYTDDVVLRHGILDAGMPFINKPFATEDLAIKIRQVLDGATAAQSGT